MRNAVAFLYIAGMVVAPFAANAASVTYDFTGTVTEALGDYGSVALGSTVTGTYTFNLGNGVPTLIGGPGESQGTVGSTTANWTAANNGGSYYVATPSSAYVFSSTANFSGFSYNTGAPGAYQDSTYVSGSLAVSPSYTFEASEKEAPTSGTSTGSSFFLEGSSPEWGSDGLPLSICHRPAYRSQGVIGILEPADDRRNEARA